MLELGSFTWEHLPRNLAWRPLLGNCCELSRRSWQDPPKRRPVNYFKDNPRCFGLAARARATRSSSECFYGLGFPHTKEGASCSSLYSTDRQLKNGSSITRRRRSLDHVMHHQRPRHTTDVQLSLSSCRVADSRLATYAEQLSVSFSWDLSLENFRLGTFAW